MLVVVESTQNAASSLTGSVGTDSDDVKSIEWAISASNIHFSSARVIGRRLDMQPLKFVVCTQMYQVCQKCYPVKEHGIGLVVGWGRGVM